MTSPHLISRRNIMSPFTSGGGGAVVVPRKGMSPGYQLAFNYSGAYRRQILDSAAAAGAKIIRLDSNSGNQAALDTVVDEVIARGMEPLIILHGSIGVITAAAAETFALSQGAKWAGNGKCRLFEFINEPDLHAWTPEQYADASWGFVSGMNATHPNAVLMLGALFKWQNDAAGAQSAAEFVRRMLVRGLPTFHYLTVHSYDSVNWNDPRNSWYQISINANNNIRYHLDNNGRSAVKIGVTEANYPMAPSGGNSEAGQAAFPTDINAKINAGVISFFCAYAWEDDGFNLGVADGYGLLTVAQVKRAAWTTYQSIPS